MAHDTKADTIGDIARLLDPTSPLPPAFASFTLLSRLSHSRHGAVLDAIAPSGTRVALKLAAVSQVPDEEELTVLVERLKTFARFKHRGIATLVDVGISAGLLYIALERIEGFLFSDLVTSSLPTSALVAVGVDLLQTVSRLERLGIHPRVLAADSIIIDDAGRPIIADFGTSVHLPTSANSDEDSSIPFAPELELGSSTAKSLQFAVGALLWDAAIAERAKVQILGEDAPRFGWIGQRNDAPDPVALVRGDPHASIRTPLMKMLQPDPAMRFSSTTEASIALLDSLEGRPTIDDVDRATIVDSKYDATNLDTVETAEFSSSASWVMSDVGSPTASAGYVLIRMPLWERARIVERVCARVGSAERTADVSSPGDAGASFGATSKPPAFLPMGVSEARDVVRPDPAPAAGGADAYSEPTRTDGRIRDEQWLRALGVNAVAGMLVGLLLAFAIQYFRAARRPIDFAEVRPYLVIQPQPGAALLEGPSGPTATAVAKASTMYQEAIARLRRKDLNGAVQAADGCIRLANLRRCHEIVVMVAAVRDDPRAAAHSAYLERLEGR